MHRISIKQFAEAILISMISLSERCHVPSLPQALDLRAYSLEHIWMLMYLWASKPDCEASEECLMIQILTVLGTPFESIFDCDAKSPKQWCNVSCGVNN